MSNTHIDSLYYKDWAHRRKGSKKFEFAKFFDFTNSIPSVPAFHWLPKYDFRNNLVADAIAGFSVGVLLLPQSMAYAELADLPPSLGLYSSTIPLVFYGIFSDTSSTAIGPVSTTCIMIANALENTGAITEQERISTATIMTFQVGIIFFIFGVLQLGWVVKLMSPAIMAGFITGVACIIPMSQVQHLFRLEMEKTPYFSTTFYHAMNAMPSIHWPTTALSLLCCFTFLLTRMYKVPRWMPTPLVVVALSCIISYTIDLEAHGFELIASIPTGLPEYETPDITRMSDSRLWISSLILACISYLSSIGLSKSFAIHRKEKINSNQEFFAYAFAHLTGAFFQSHVVSGSFSRTALNNALNAQSQISTVMQAVFVCSCLLVLTKPLEYLPRCVLSALIATSVMGLFKVSVMKFLYQTNTLDFIFFMTAFIGTLALGIEPGICVGCVIQALSIICRSAIPRFSTLGRLPKTNYYVQNSAFIELEDDPVIHIAQFGTDLIYTNMDVFERHVHTALHEIGLRACILDFSQVEYIDSAGVDILSQCSNIADEVDVPLLLVSPPASTRRAIDRGFEALDLTPPSYFLSVNSAIQWVKESSRVKLEPKLRQFDGEDSPPSPKSKPINLPLEGDTSIQIRQQLEEAFIPKKERRGTNFRSVFVTF